MSEINSPNSSFSMKTVQLRGLWQALHQRTEERKGSVLSFSQHVSLDEIVRHESMLSTCQVPALRLLWVTAILRGSALLTEQGEAPAP